LELIGFIKGPDNVWRKEGWPSVEDDEITEHHTRVALRLMTQAVAHGVDAFLR